MVKLSLRVMKTDDYEGSREQAESPRLLQHSSAVFSEFNINRDVYRLVFL